MLLNKYTMNMKTRKLAFVLFTLLAFNLNAQSDYASYLSKAMEKLNVGDCESAQKFYNVYKDLSGKSKPSVQVLIDDCMQENKYRIGGKIVVDGEEYTIAHLVGNKSHGFAIRDIGVISLCVPNTLEYLRKKMIPSLDEMKIIYSNNDNIGLTGKYWTSSVYGYGDYTYYYLLDFLTGKEYYAHQQTHYGVLLIHRF